MKKNTSICRLGLVAILSSMLFLSGCSGVETEAKYPTGADRGSTDDIYAEPESVFGEDGLSGLFGGSEKREAADATVGIGVNSYLWRASLDTISFMPLATADPFGGVILTDWYSPPENSNERFKLNVFILDRQLRSDAIEVKVFRQVNRNGAWRDSSTSDDTGRKLEDAILTRARQMRVAQIGTIE